MITLWNCQLQYCMKCNKWHESSTIQSSTIQALLCCYTWVTWFAKKAIDMWCVSCCARLVSLCWLFYSITVLFITFVVLFVASLLLLLFLLLLLVFLIAFLFICFDYVYHVCIPSPVWYLSIKSRKWRDCVCIVADFHFKLMIAIARKQEWTRNWIRNGERNRFFFYDHFWCESNHYFLVFFVFFAFCCSIVIISILNTPR